MHTHDPFLTTENYRCFCLQKHLRTACHLLLVSLWVFKGAQRIPPVPFSFLLGVNNAGHVPRCLSRDSSYITTLFSNWFLSLPLERF